MGQWTLGQAMGSRGNSLVSWVPAEELGSRYSSHPKNSLGLTGLKGNERERDRRNYWLRSPQLLSLLFLRTASSKKANGEEVLGSVLGSAVDTPVLITHPVPSGAMQTFPATLESFFSPL